MDTDVNIFNRQLDEGDKQRYILWKRLEELVKELPKYDVYLTASEEEAGANHVLEAMAVGLPVLYGSKGGSINEYCKGYGTKYSSFEDLKIKIDSIKSDLLEYNKKTICYNRKISDVINQYINVIENKIQEEV